MYMTVYLPVFRVYVWSSFNTFCIYVRFVSFYYVTLSFRHMSMCIYLMATPWYRPAYMRHIIHSQEETHAEVLPRRIIG